MRRLIIDTDTASDDAVALIMALREPQVTVEAITIVSGNVPVAQASRNARYVVELCGAEIPVYEGADRPLVKPRAHATHFHGEDGLGDIGYPPPRLPAAQGYAALEIIRRCQAAPGEIELVTLGPLSNVAMALRLEPRLAGWVRHCTVMGGAAATLGNVTPAAEFNLWCDPEAARIVLHSGMPVTLVGWELSRGEACFTSAELEAVRALNTELARFAVDCNRAAFVAATQTQAEAGLSLPDPVAMAIALDPDTCAEAVTCGIEVVLDGPARGATLVDILSVAGRGDSAGDPAWASPLPTVEVCRMLDVARFKVRVNTALS
ncbi:MAG: nucleoside hydrolase [Acidihalobacter sp.]|jgi:purine nucleosidase